MYVSSQFHWHFELIKTLNYKSFKKYYQVFYNVRLNFSEYSKVYKANLVLEYLKKIKIKWLCIDCSFEIKAIKNSYKTIIEIFCNLFFLSTAVLLFSLKYI